MDKKKKTFLGKGILRISLLLLLLVWGTSHKIPEKTDITERRAIVDPDDPTCGLQYSAAELALWRERAGLIAGTRAYTGEWDRILADAKTAVANSANDRYTNYDVTQGLNGPLTELNSSWVPDNTWPARESYIDDKEPRPGINGQDYGALSILHAGFVHLLLGDNGSIGSDTGIDFATAVKTELLHYSGDQWLDFTNTSRFVRSGDTFADRNPGFFIATWLNSLLTAYDYTKNSSVYSASERQTIESWFHGAMDFYHDLLMSNMSGAWGGTTRYMDEDYSGPSSTGWNATSRGEPYDGAPYTAYGLNEYYSNRRCQHVRFLMRAGLLLRGNATLGGDANGAITLAHRWIKEWMVFGNFSDGTNGDMHRGGSSNPQQGLQYATIGIGSIIDAVDSYERVMSQEPGFESLYDWEVVRGLSEYNRYLPSQTSGHVWRSSFDVPTGKPRNLRMIIDALLKHFDGSYGSTRSWSGQVIDGYQPTSPHFVKFVESDRWVAPAVMYYATKDAAWASNAVSIYTRTKQGTNPLSSNPTKAGSFDINVGSWGGHPSTLLMYGRTEGLSNPYKGCQEVIENEEEEEVESSVSNGYWSVQDGNWEDASTWSTKADGSEAALSPPDSLSKVYIQGHQVTLNSDAESGDIQISDKGLVPGGLLIDGRGQEVLLSVTGEVSVLRDSVIGSGLDIINGGGIDVIAPERSFPEDAGIAPSELMADNKTAYSMVLSWIPPSDLDQVRSQAIKRDGRTVATLSNTARGHTLTGLMAGREYRIQVVSLGYNGEEFRDGGSEVIIERTTASVGGLLVEAESGKDYVEGGDDNGPVEAIASGSLNANGGMAIYDPGDRFRVDLPISATGRYTIKVRLRSGAYRDADYDRPTAYWPNGYIFRLDGREIVLTGDPMSITGPIEAVGGSYWGTMSSEELELSSGTRSLEIEAVNSWGAVDYIEVSGGSTGLPAPLNLTVGNITETGSTLSWTAPATTLSPLTYTVYLDGTSVGTSSMETYTITGCIKL